MRLNLNDMQEMQEASFDVGEKTAFRYIISSKEGVTISADGKEIIHLPPGLHAKAIVLENVESIKIKADGKKMSAAFAMTDLTVGEQIDDQLPPPPAASNNLLAQIREKVRREMGVTRENFLLVNDTGYPGYELDDDEPELFEEELSAVAKAKAEKEKETAAQAATTDSEARSAEEKFSENNQGTS